MEALGRKRRSEDCAYIPQSKMHISDKIVDANNSTKMRQIHAKTVELLFGAARTQPPDLKNACDGQQAKWREYLLTGNGKIQMKNFTEYCEDSLMVLEKANCCQRQTYIRDNCSNCTLPMCEHCGYSCHDCGSFLCYNCVSVFGCGTTDRPICEKCTLYQ